MPTRVTTTAWLWALLPLLLAATIVIPLLDVDAFNGDEPASLLAAGILRTGSWSILDVWENTAPRHPPGWAMLLSIWGPFVGWSELAIRALSLFIGLLTLAWVYRAGRDFFAPAAGLIAALLLSASVFHLAYMARADLYAPGGPLRRYLCLVLLARALHPQQPGKGVHQAGLLLGSIGLLYSHYLGALLLPVLGLFHLLFVPKDRRWWRPVLLFGLATLAGAVQLPLLPRGLAYTESEELGSRFLVVPAFLSHLLSSHDQWPCRAISSCKRASASRPAACADGRHPVARAGIDTRVVWLLVFASAILLALVIAINDGLRVIADTRIRYLMPLWP